MVGFFYFSVCDDACREFVLDQSSGLLLCTISGHCFERWLCPDDEWDADDDTVSLLHIAFFLYPSNNLAVNLFYLDWHIFLHICNHFLQHC